MPRSVADFSRAIGGQVLSSVSKFVGGALRGVGGRGGTHRGGIDLRAKMIGDKQLAAKFTQIRGRAANLKPALVKIEKNFFAIERQQFKTLGQRGGKKWAKLSEATKKRKRRGGFPMKIMIRKGKLFDSLQGKQGYVSKLTPKTLTIGTNIPYAAAHQQGTKDLPARPLIALTKNDLSRWMRIIGAHVVSGK